MPSSRTEDVSEALRHLAADVRSGSTLERAIEHSDAGPLVQARRLVALGESPEQALRALDHKGVDDLVAGLSMCRHAGGDVAALLEQTAGSIEERSNQDARARSYVAGARASARTVAALPFVSMVVLLFSGISPLSGAGVITVPFGAALAFAGMRWMSTLIPTWSNVDNPAWLAQRLASAARAGIGLYPALSAAARSATEGALIDARRRVQLGFIWSEALASTDDAALRQLARQIERSESSGVPIADALDSWANERKERSRRDFEARIRRAPVTMALPLTLCVLPAFILLGIVPFFHGVSLGP